MSLINATVGSVLPLPAKNGIEREMHLDHARPSLPDGTRVFDGSVHSKDGQVLQKLVIVKLVPGRNQSAAL